MKTTLLAGTVLTMLCTALIAQQNNNLGYTDTPMQPNGKWHIHDPARPQPTVVAPGGAESLMILSLIHI